MNECLKKITRLSAWGLLIGVIIMAVSGWGITRTEIIYQASFGLIDRGVANSIHRASHIPVAFLFLTHVLTMVRLRLPQRCLKRTWLANTLIIAVGAGLFGLAIYIEFFP